jgi:hypothetical protein
MTKIEEGKRYKFLCRYINMPSMVCLNTKIRGYDIYVHIDKNIQANVGQKIYLIGYVETLVMRFDDIYDIHLKNTVISSG